MIPSKTDFRDMNSEELWKIYDRLHLEIINIEEESI